jgi:hypothetical protein
MEDDFMVGVVHDVSGKEDSLGARPPLKEDQLPLRCCCCGGGGDKDGPSKEGRGWDDGGLESWEDVNNRAPFAWYKPPPSLVARCLGAMMGVPLLLLLPPSDAFRHGFSCPLP